MTTREKIIVEGEDRASREFDKASGSFERMGQTLKRVATAGGIAIAAKKTFDLAKTVTGMAVDAFEAESAFETAFGRALPQASAFVDEFANKAGFARYELQQMLAVTGSVIQGIGATEEESAALGARMATLAGDVASFTNATGGAEAVLGALQSAINGEREALKTYGLAIAETEVQQRALNATGKARADELTRLEKAEATIALAYEKSGKALGDLDRTQDSAANTLRRLGARLKEAGVEAGDRMLPALEALLPKLEESIPALTDAAVAIAQLGGNALAAATGPLSQLGDVLDGVALISNQTWASLALGRQIIEETFSLGLADTSALSQGRKAAERANHLRIMVRAAREEMAGGGDAATTLANSLVQLAGMSGFTEEGMLRLASATGATNEEQLAALQTIRQYADENNWRPENIDNLRMSILGLQEDLGQVTSPEAHKFLVGMGTAASDAATGIGELPDKMPPAVEAIEDMAKAAEEGAAALRDDLAKEAQSFITGFEKLPDRVDTTMDEFEKNLTDRIEAQTAFWEGLATLARSGFGHLAEEIRTQGPAAAGLLEDLVGNMERAAELDALINQAGDQMQDVTGEYASALERYGDPTLTALSQYGQDIIKAISDGIRSGDLAGPLLAHVRSEVSSVTGQFIAPSAPTRRSGSGTQRFQEGTWDVPGSGPLAAIVHGGETIFGPPGTSGRAAMVSELAAELGRVIGNSRERGGVNVTIESLQVLVPAGTTVQEAVNAATAQAAVEALMS